MREHRLVTTLLCFLGIIFYTPAFAETEADRNGEQPKIIRFNMSPKGYPPFTIIKDNGAPSGLIFDVLRKVTDKYNYQIKMFQIPRKRVNLYIHQGIIDATPRAKEWTKKPEDFIFTDPIILTNDVVVSLKQNPIKSGLNEDLTGKHILIYLGYKYPSLENSFKHKKILKAEVTSNQEMFHRLFKANRYYDGLIINQQVALWTIKKNNWGGLLQISKIPTSEVGYRLMFGKQWRSFVNTFNTELANLKSTGQLEKIVNQYR